MNKYLKLFLILSVFVLAGCDTKEKQNPHSLKVMASAVPHAQLLEFAKPDLDAKGIDLTIIITEDYNIPNRALADNEIDANFFQHLPYLETQIRQFGYPIESLAKIEIEPMGLYSTRLKNLDDLPDGGTIAIPNDPTNEARALLLLQQHGIITLTDPENPQATVLDIQDNPKQLKFQEVDAAMIPRTLKDVDLAAINTNYALEANLNPTNDALALESTDSPYANIIVIRTVEANRPELLALKEAMTSEKMKNFIEEKYKGAVLPAF